MSLEKAMNTNAQAEREKEIFKQAVEMISPTERHSFLNIACVGDSALRARVDALLRAHDGVDPTSIKASENGRRIVSPSTSFLKNT